MPQTTTLYTQFEYENKVSNYDEVNYQTQAY